MVISRREIKRKRKETTSTCSLLDDSPKRTKVHAQRKFAQGSNVSSPVITPVKEIEKQEKLRPDVLPEPQELLPMNRPHTEDFLTFLCFRGTSMLPPSLNFFNAAPVDSRVHTQPLKSEPIDVIPPLANLSTKTVAGTSERPFIAFGVRKRADPILVSKHMDKKRRHALALQALRRKYQEQKMAKIRAVTISKLSEKTTSKSLVRTRSVTKNETTTKKSLTQKTRVKIVATKHVRVTTRSSIKTPLRTTLSSPIRTQIQKRMCLRSFRGRFIQRELNMQKPKKKPNKVLKKQEVKTETKKKKETSSEFSSDDDQPLVKTVKVLKPSNKVHLPKVTKKCASTPKKPIEIRVTRASRPLLTSTRDQTIKRKIQISRTLPTKLPFVKLTPPKLISPKQKHKEEKVRLMRTRRSDKSESHEEDEKHADTKGTEEEKPKKIEKKEKKIEDKKKSDTSPDLKKKIDKPTSSKRAEKLDSSPEKDLKNKDINIEKDVNVKKKSEVIIEKEIKRRSDTTMERDLRRRSDISLEKDLKKKLEVNLEKDLRKKSEVILEKDLRKKSEVVLEKTLKKKSEVVLEKDTKKKPEVVLEKDTKKKPETVLEKDIKKKPEVVLEKDLKKKPEAILESDVKKKPEPVLERDLKKKQESNTEKNIKKKLELNLEKDTKKKIEANTVEDIKKKAEVIIEKDLRKTTEVILEKDTKKKLEVSIERETRRKSEITLEKDSKKKSENTMDLKKKQEINIEKNLKKKPEINIEKDIKKPEMSVKKDTKKKPEINLEKDLKKETNVNLEKELKKKPETIIDKETTKPVNKTETKKAVDKTETSTEKELEINIQKDVNKLETKSEILPEKKQKPNKTDITTESKIEVLTEKKKSEKLEISAEKKKPEKTETPTETDTTKKKSIKSDNTEKKKSKNEIAIVVEPRVSQRPTRKTKEAAAIYMEILGHKLVSEGDMDDDSISIDSFPELPNVRKTEQRENELKAKAKSKSNENPKPSDDKNSLKPKPKKSDINESDNATNTKKPKSEETIKKKETEKIKAKDIFSDSDSSVKKIKKGANLSKKPEIPETTKRTTRSSLPNKELPLEVLSSDSEESETEINQDKKLISITPINLNISMKTRSQVLEESSSESDESTTSKTNKNQTKNFGKNKKFTKASTAKLDNSFSDSDEEPLSKLTLLKSKQNENQENETPKTILKRKSTEHDQINRKEPVTKQAKKDTTKVQEKKKDDQPTLSSTKPKRECTKRPQNYLTIFSSSEDEEKYFHGFVKNESAKSTKTVKPETKCHPTASADLLCKDVDKRFGKGKVNMSTEQIEKWLKDSALAGSAIKKETFDEKHSSETTVDLNLPSKVETDLKSSNIKKAENEAPNKTESKSVTTNTKPTEYPSSTNIPVQDKQHKHIPQSTSNKVVERKTIFRKERKMPAPNISAFSPNNESSVYAFEAENEDAISTPFRRPTRRPSSTATSRSEDSSKYEESSKTAGKFRLPSAVKQDTVKNANKQEVSLMLSTDEISNSASIAVQLDLDSTEVFPEPVITQTETEDSEQLFYIPLQPGKQSSSQLIQGVAVKLGTKGANGPNQRVVMSAKLVTHTPVGAQKLLEKPLATSSPMYPPTSTIQKSKPSESSLKGIRPGKSNERISDNSEDFKYKIPSSPSASSSSSTKVTKRQHMKTRIRPFEYLNPINSNEFPSSSHSTAALLEAPVFYPNEKEFQDPLEYIEKIKVHAEKFGICRIVPPSNFKPECRVSDDMRFTAYNQYVHKMLHRWGPNFKELMAITKYLETQNIALTHPPWIGGMEIDLPRLYQIVQSLGGLKEVIEKKRWPKVSELMKIPKSAQDRVTKLDDIYCKYLLPYDTLSPDEREKLFDEVETEWAKRESRALLRSQQKIINRDTSPNSESDSDDESEECIVKGRSMALNAFYRIARNTMSMWFKTMEPSAQEVEQEFWKHVTVKQNHICVHSGSIDSGSWGYGFAVTKNSPFARHAWNLKVLTNNSGSVLRSMAPVMGVTVPTLHVGMVFSACCWYRDPHSLPWIEYLHTGGNKIWYGIPDSMSEVFHSTLIKLVPNYCGNKALWLPSDTAMVPPSLLVENGVSLCRTIQEPGQFIVVFPKAFTSSLCTGYVVSESVYFAPLSWLTTAQKIFDELQDSCEPSMFSLEKLLVSIALDARSSVDVLRQIIPAIELLCEKETLSWRKLQELGLNEKEKLPLPEAPIKKRKKLQNDSGDYECEICCKNLFISWVIESQEGIYCLEHAIEYIEKKKIELQNCKLMYTYNSEDLKNLIEKVKSTIEMKLQKKTAGKST